MKKISSFIIASMLILVATASARQSRVILDNNSINNVCINDRIYNKDKDNISIVNLDPGAYKLKLFSSNSGNNPALFKKNALVASKSFVLLNEDVSITVNADGSININQEGNRGGRVTSRRPRNNRNYDDDENNDWNRSRQEVSEQTFTHTASSKQRNLIPTIQYKEPTNEFVAHHKAPCGQCSLIIGNVKPLV